MLHKTEYSVSLPSKGFNFQEAKTTLNEPLGRFFYDPWQVKPEYKNTIWEDLLKSLPVDQGEARVIKLDYGTTYMSHTDIDDRWHLTLQGERSYLIDLDEEQMFLTQPDGNWYEMNAGKRHVASNYGNIHRYQLVVRKLLIESEHDNLVNIKIQPVEELFDTRYQFDNLISPWLNTINKQGAMKDFNYENVTVTFKITPAALATFPKQELFKVIT